MYKNNYSHPINKSATDTENHYRPVFSYTNARTAFKAFMMSLSIRSEDEVWLPAYIGWSSREGSGVFDPVREVGARFKFYKVTESLEIDIDHLFGMFKMSRPRLLVLIHFFGFPDQNIEQISKWAKEREIAILEDEAHALYSDWIGNICGRYGDAAIMSLHKMLPFQSGGLLVFNRKVSSNTAFVLNEWASPSPPEYRILSYDLLRIALIRRRNAEKLLQLLRTFDGSVTPLYARLPDGVVPQTIPVRIWHGSRDDLYFKLNEEGFGVVSLYHTLIEQISVDQFPSSHALARNILNLPVHQDVTPEKLEVLVEKLGTMVS